ncbi:serine O-acetyltransferase [Rhodococcoides fascians]|uniref:serine O-acetyltransferase n=1 Tax=Rhodococcoides fascians TaxID=1828 RepID=UPI0009B8F050|nr:hypothetical protein [Rhodococcus fascians]
MFIESKQDLRYFLDQDLKAHGLNRWNLLQNIKSPELSYQRTLRRAEYWNFKKTVIAKPLAIIYRVRLLRKSVKTGISVPMGVAGPGLAVPHLGSVVINSGVKVGRNFRIHSSTNVGSTKEGVPVIGDNVYVGPGAVVFGPINIGAGALIGANSVVNRDVPSGVTVGGVPARIISQTGAEQIHPYFEGHERKDDQ